jgi:hypothetical protein
LFCCTSSASLSRSAHGRQAGTHPNYPKIGVKLAILIVIGGLLGMGNARQRRTGEAVPRPVFALIGLLSLIAAGIAVLW